LKHKNIPPIGLASPFLYNRAGKELRAVEIGLKSEAWIDPEADLTSVSESLGLRQKKPFNYYYYHTTNGPISQVPTVSSEGFVRQQLGKFRATFIEAEAWRGS